MDDGTWHGMAWRGQGKARLGTVNRLTVDQLGASLVMITDTRDKAREQRIRRLLDNQGYILRKSRRRGWPTPDDHGQYMILDARSNIPAVGWRYDLDLDKVEAWATEDEPDE